MGEKNQEAANRPRDSEGLVTVITQQVFFSLISSNHVTLRHPSFTILHLHYNLFASEDLNSNETTCDKNQEK